jgi:hypothetical protein
MIVRCAFTAAAARLLHRRHREIAVAGNVFTVHPIIALAVGVRTLVLAIERCN